MYTFMHEVKVNFVCPSDKISFEYNTFWSIFWNFLNDRIYIYPRFCLSILLSVDLFTVMCAVLSGRWRRIAWKWERRTSPVRWLCTPPYQSSARPRMTSRVISISTSTPSTTTVSFQKFQMLLRKLIL